MELLATTATEHELITSMDTASQPTANRRLARLAETRLIQREPGKRRAPGRLWTVVHPVETDALIEALLTLSETIEARDRARRTEARRKLRLARADRLGIRDVDASHGG